MKSSWKSLVVHYDQETEWRDLKREVFDRQIYYFETEKSAPVIFDVGAHIGLATLYFKWLYPGSQIWSFEPNPALFARLRQNVDENALADVTLIPAAVSRHTGQVPFFVDETPWQWWSVGSLKRGAWNGEQKAQKEIMVDSVKLSDFVQNQSIIDLLKLDIEGSEQSVLYSFKGQLNKILEIIFEFHPTREQNLNDLKRFLIHQGFKVSFFNRKNQIVRSFRENELVLVRASREK